MPSAIPPNTREIMDEPDDLDRMLDYEDAVEDFLKDIPVGNSSAPALEERPRDEDQEVQVKRKRKPVPKLDEERLLSEAGLPRLRKITKKRLQFRGKHHEFSDVSKLLSTYQLWLDDLYPRAKFRDALTIVEKLGHTKRMQVMRKGWLDSTKPNRLDSTSAAEEIIAEADRPDGGVDREPEAENGDDTDNGTGQTQTQTQGDGQTPASRGSALDKDQPDALAASNPAAWHGSDAPSDDELDALLAENEGNQPREVAPRRVPFEEDEDDLDTLLAEQLGGEHAGPSSTLGQPRLADTHGDFADEAEAMVEMGGMW